MSIGWRFGSNVPRFLASRYILRKIHGLEKGVCLVFDASQQSWGVLAFSGAFRFVRAISVSKRKKKRIQVPKRVKGFMDHSVPCHKDSVAPFREKADIGIPVLVDQSHSVFAAHFGEKELFGSRVLVSAK